MLITVSTEGTKTQFRINTNFYFPVSCVPSVNCFWNFWYDSEVSLGIWCQLGDGRLVDCTRVAMIPPKERNIIKSRGKQFNPWKKYLCLQIELVFIMEVKMNSAHESHETHSTYSLGRTHSVPKDMHLIFRKSSLSTTNTSAITSTPSVKADPSSFIRRVLSDLREADSSTIGKESCTSSVRTNPGQFMRGMLSDLQQVDSFSKPQFPPPIFERGTIPCVPEFDSNPEDLSFGLPLSKQRSGDKGKCFSSVSSAKHSTTTGATATMVTDFSGTTSDFDCDEIIRLVPDCEEKTEDDPVDAAALAKLRRDRNRSWNFSTINVLQVGRIPRVGNGINGKARKTKSSSLFARTKYGDFSRKSNLGGIETSLASAIAESFPSFQQDNKRIDSAIPSKTLSVPTDLATPCNDFQDHDKDVESEIDSEATSFVDAEDFEFQKKKGGRSLFSRTNANRSNRRNMPSIESNSENILLQISIS